MNDAAGGNTLDDFQQVLDFFDLKAGAGTQPGAFYVTDQLGQFMCALPSTIGRAELTSVARMCSNRFDVGFEAGRQSAFDELRKLIGAARAEVST